MTICPGDELGHAERCPLCSRDNACRAAKGHLYKGPCWCHQISVPNSILRRLAENAVTPACLCRSCLENIAHISNESGSTEEILAKIQARNLADPSEQLGKPEPASYLDADGITVFTAGTI